MNKRYLVVCLTLLKTRVSGKLFEFFKPLSLMSLLCPRLPPYSAPEASSDQASAAPWSLASRLRVGTCRAYSGSAGDRGGSKGASSTTMCKKLGIASSGSSVAGVLFGGLWATMLLPVTLMAFAGAAGVGGYSRHRLCSRHWHVSRCVGCCCCSCSFAPVRLFLGATCTRTELDES